SLLVTTYQAGKLVMVRDEGDHLNTHYRAFPSPMGLALADAGSKLAVGTTLQVWEFRDVPSVARRLEPAGRHDACFLPRQSHGTGNVLRRPGRRGEGGGCQQARRQGADPAAASPRLAPPRADLAREATAKRSARRPRRGGEAAGALATGRRPRRRSRQ